MKLSINKYIVYRYIEFIGICTLKIEIIINDKLINKILFDLNVIFG